MVPCVHESLAVYVVLRHWCHLLAICSHHTEDNSNGIKKPNTVKPGHILLSEIQP